MKAKQIYDVLIIGAGHNGLTCAGYLARKGLSVKVVERRNIVGGAAVTQEFHPGFRNTTCSYALSMLAPKIIEELELEKYGLHIYTDEHPMLALSTNGDYMFINDDYEAFDRALAKQDPGNTEGFEKMSTILEQIADFMRDVAVETPANLGGGLMDLWRAGKLSNNLRKLTPELQAEMYRLFTMSIRDYLKRFIKGDMIQATEAWASQVGNFQSVRAGGTAYVLLHHMFGIVNGKKGEWAIVKGGMGGITQAMAKSAEAFGVDIELEAPVADVLIENDKAVGVRLEDGREFSARAVAANVHPQLLFQKMVADEYVPATFKENIDNYRSNSGTFRMNVALHELPKFTALKDIPEEDYRSYLQGTMLFADSLDYYEDAYQDAQALGWARKPVINAGIQSIIDDSLAPEGKHVMSLFCQHFNKELPDGRSWDEVKDEVAQHIIEHVNKYYAPNFKEAVVGYMALSPLDLEREYGLVGGDIFHGRLDPDQLYSMRPAPGYADYRMPVKGLYLCGSGAHPGGGVSGYPGHNAAREIIKDL